MYSYLYVVTDKSYDYHVIHIHVQCILTFYHDTHELTPSIIISQVEMA